MKENKYIKIKNQIKKHISKLGKEIIKEILGLKRLRIGKLKIEEYISLSLYIQAKQIKNLKDFYEEDLDNFIQVPKPSYANFLRNLHSYGKITQHLLELRINQNLLNLLKKKEILLLLDSTKIPLTNHPQSFKSHKYNIKGKPTKGYSSTGGYFGYKASAITDENNLLYYIDIQTASVHDNYVLPLLVNEEIKIKQKEGQTIKILADKGYINKKAKLELAQKNIALITPNRKNMKTENEDFNSKEYKKRQGLTTVLSNIKIIKK